MHVHLSTLTPTPGMRTGNKPPQSSFICPPLCSTAFTNTRSHLLDKSVPKFTERFATGKHTHTLPFFSFSFCLSGSVNRCWVITHHAPTYFSSLPVFLCGLSHGYERQTSLTLHNSVHLPHPSSVGFSYMEWIQFFLISAHFCLLINSWFSQTSVPNLVKCWPYIWSYRGQMNAMID